MICIGYYSGLGLLLVLLTIWLPINAGESKEILWLNEQLRILEESTGVKNLDPKSAEVKEIFEAGKQVGREAMKSTGNFVALIAAGFILTVGVFYKASTYLDIVIFNLPTLFLFGIDGIDTNIYILAVIISFSGILVRKQLFGRQ